VRGHSWAHPHPRLRAAPGAAGRAAAWAVTGAGRGKERSLLRGRREARREDRQAFGRGGTAAHYQMRQRLRSVGDDFWIENDRGERVYTVDGKALRVRQTLLFEDAAGNELCQIQERTARVRDRMEIEGPGGERLAVVTKAMLTPLRERGAVAVADGPDLEVQGNLLDHEYTIGEGRDQVAEVSKQWFRVADTYGVEVAPGQNAVLLLAVTVALDSMAHEGR